jgi:hypothetical protein
MKDVFIPVDVQSQLSGAGMFPSTHPILTFSLTAVLPEQFFSLPSHHGKGEAALMYAILEDAFNCFTKQFVDNGLRVQRLAKEAEAWFFSEDERWPFSFVNVCTVLGINPEYLRKGLQQWRQQRPTQRRQIRGQAIHRSSHLRTAA